MKIALYHELAFGGALRAVEAYAVELAKRHDVTLYAVTDAPVNALTGVHRKTYPFHSDEPKGLRARLSHDVFDLLRLRKLAQAIAAEINASDVDVVFVHPSRWTQAPFLLGFLTVPSVYYAQEALRIVYDDIHNKIGRVALPNLLYEKCNRQWRKWIDAKNIHAASYVLVNSTFTQANIKAAYGIDASVCHLGVNTKLFRKLRLKKVYDVLFFGSPVEEEGFDVFEDAQGISKRPWRIATLQRKLDGTGVTDTELVKLINQSRIAISLEHHHPFGINMIEANACGTAVIAVNEGGYRDGVISGKTGLLVERDPSAVELAIRTLLSKPTYCERLGQTGRERVDAYWTWERSAQRLETHLKRVLTLSHTEKHVAVPSKAYSLFYVCMVVTSLFIMRLGFRAARTTFPIPHINHGVIGYAQYTGYPLFFETYYFGVMFLLPIVAAIVLRMVWERRHI